jgi:hypothetical protein
VTLAAIHAVDLLAFGALGLAGLVVAAVLLGLGVWLRQRARRPGESGYYAGL